MAIFSYLRLIADFLHKSNYGFDIDALSHNHVFRSRVEWLRRLDDSTTESLAGLDGPLFENQTETY